MPTPIKTQFIAITFEDDSVGVMQMILEEKLGNTIRSVAPIDEVIEKEISRSSFDKKVKGWKKILPHTIPQDRKFRDAWRHDGEEFYHDMNKAKEIHLGRIRAARAPELVKLDVEYIRAVEDNDVLKRDAVVNRKKRLRDLPQTLDFNVETVEELDKIWPDELPR